MSFELDLYDVMLGQLADIGIEILSDRPKESERNRESACAKPIYEISRSIYVRKNNKKR